VELEKEFERLRAEINRLNNHTRVEAKHLTDLYVEAKRLQMEKAQKASSLNEKRSKLLSKIEELEKEATRRGEDLNNATKSFKQDGAQSYLVGFEATLDQAATIHPTLYFSELGPGKPWSMVN